MAKPYKRGNIWWVGITSNGVQKCISLKTKNYQEALQKVKELNTQNKSLKLSDILEICLDSNPQKSERTKFDYRRVMTEFQKWIGGNKPVGKITRYEIEDYLNFLKKERELADSTCGIQLRSLAAIFNYSFRRGLIQNDPFKNVKIPRGKPKNDFLELSQMDKLYEVAEKDSPHYKLYIEFMLLTGCRIGELGNLTLADFDTNMRYITFRGKSGERRFPVDELLIDCIKNIFVHHFTILDDKECNLLNDPDHKFLMNSRGTPFSDPNVFGKIIKGYMREAGLPKKFTPHSLRHTFASHLAMDKETKIEHIAAWLGHKSITTTEKFYAHLRPEQLKINRPYGKKPVNSDLDLTKIFDQSRKTDQ